MATVSFLWHHVMLMHIKPTKQQYKQVLHETLCNFLEFPFNKAKKKKKKWKLTSEHSILWDKSASVVIKYHESLGQRHAAILTMR